MNLMTLPLVALLATPLFPDPPPECVCNRDWTETSGAGEDGKMGWVEYVEAVPHIVEWYRVRLDVNDGDEGLCYSPTECTGEADPCNWTYVIDVELTDDQNKEQIEYLQHRGTRKDVDGASTLTFSRELSLACGAPKVMRVNAYNVNEVQIATATAGSVECIQCTQIE